MILGKALFLIGLILQIVIRYPYRNDRQRTPGDRQEQILLLLLTIGGMLLPFVYIFTNWLRVADYNASWWVIGLGALVLAHDGLHPRAV